MAGVISKFNKPLNLDSAFQNEISVGLDVSEKDKENFMYSLYETQKY